jgi:hypothetical protein
MQNAMLNRRFGLAWVVLVLASASRSGATERPRTEPQHRSDHRGKIAYVSCFGNLEEDSRVIRRCASLASVLWRACWD